MKHILTFCYKLTHWEYWPMQLVYFPLFPVWLFLAIKSRSFFFFNAANPLIKNGGMAMESKNDIYQLIPKQYIPTTLFFPFGTAYQSILSGCHSKGIHYPFIIKPDIGMKGLGVALIHSKNELSHYLNTNQGNYIVQEYIQYPKEIGIFYVRHPNNTIGTITGIVSKEFLTVQGDGQSTISNLIQKNPRSRFQLKRLEKRYGSTLEQILERGKSKIVMPIGSHTLGAKFVDISRQCTPELTKRLNNICNQIPEFHYGRLDIKLTNLKDLAQGKNFSIIELNGAGSEPTHIYDPKHSLWFGWKEIIRHWNLLQKISENNADNGVSYLSFNEGREMLRQNNLLAKRLSRI